jgi:membrane protease subunit (stomatin/prohibitin family)
MGLFSSKKEGGFMDAIRTPDKENEYFDPLKFLIWKWRPSADGLANDLGDSKKENSLRWGSPVTVKQGQVAYFLYKKKDGTAEEIIDASEETKEIRLDTGNFPILSSILGLGFNGDTPFPASIYFINLNGSLQIKFGLRIDEVVDYRTPDFGVPVFVRGNLTVNIPDYKAFVRLNTLTNFDIDKFGNQIQNAVVKFIKGTVANISVDLNTPVISIERKILDVNDWVHQRIKSSLEEDFAINIKRLDIAHLEIDKESDGYRKLRELTADISEKRIKTQNVQIDAEVQTFKAQTDLNIKNIQDTQRINAENTEESLRIQREQYEKAQSLQTETNNLELMKLKIQTDAQKTILTAAANNLGEMGTMNLGGSAGGGMNPAGMMTGMMMGGAMGNQMAGMMNQMGNSMNPQNPQTPQNNQMPPPPPVTQYLLSVNGQQAGPFNMQQLQQLVMNGQLLTNTFVWKQGMQNWVEAGQVMELQSLFTSMPPPPPPMPPTMP